MFVGIGSIPRWKKSLRRWLIRIYTRLLGVGPSWPQVVGEEGRPNKKYSKGDTVFMAKNLGPCANCGKPAQFISLSFEGWFCSSACLEKFWADYYADEAAYAAERKEQDA